MSTISPVYGSKHSIILSKGHHPAFWVFWGIFETHRFSMGSSEAAGSQSPESSESLWLFFYFHMIDSIIGSSFRMQMM